MNTTLDEVRLCLSLLSGLREIFAVFVNAAMSGSSGESSDDLYEPGESGSDTSDSDISTSDSEIDENDEEVEGIVEEGWQFLADIFGDVRPQPLPLFTDGNAGVNAALGPRPFHTPGAAFSYFFDDEVMGKVLSWINERADVFLRENPGKTKVHSLMWRPVSMDELHVFFALILVMGIIKYPRLHMYWSRNGIFSGPRVFCKEVMSRNRFFSILKFLRFSSAASVRAGTPGTRIEPYLDLLRNRCQTLMRPATHVAVDEALVLWKGRLGFRQFIKTKRSRFGIKVFVLCPSGENWNGYSWNFDIYYGKSSFKIDDPAAAHLSVSEDIVVHLMKDLLDQGRHVVTDNWYTSVRLSDYLQTRKTMMTGVVRSGRGPPKKIISEKLERHQSVFARKGNTLLVKYQDKKEVTVLTTKYKADMVEKNKTYFGNTTVFYNKPLHIDRYNNLMGSVDMADQLLEPYVFGKKSLAWFKKIGIHFMFRALLNAFLVYRNTCQHKGEFLDYIMAVAKEWLSEHNRAAAAICQEEEARKHKRPIKVVEEASLIHAWVRHEQSGKQKRCRVCTSKDKKRKDTVYYCPGCPGEPGLCSMEHFREWHTTPPGDPQPGPSGVPPRKKKRTC